MPAVGAALMSLSTVIVAINARLLEHALHFATELDCVRRFSDLADELGLPAVGPGEEVVSGHESLTGDIVRQKAVLLV